CLPDKIAFEVVTVEALCIEESPHKLAICHWCRRGEGVLAVTVVEDGAFVSGLLPENPAGVAVEAKDFDRVAMISPDAVGMNVHLAAPRVRHCLCPRHDRSFHRGSQKNPIAPDDWR